MHISNSPVAFFFTVILVSQAGSFDTAKDLTTVIALQGKPCGTVTRFPFKYMHEFRQYERVAREQNRGLWGKSR